eukprot:TRINITY_DN5176_c0_g1_i1.p1 TRINITY_DN5176_c0_g1~~TRINITY_DN5176_c0_g1_i1.p1  ORF type:complete len:491 (+),score=73.94 TRINITY_DN5176_c0_g1_i1:124-1596(+)
MDLVHDSVHVSAEESMCRRNGSSSKADGELCTMVANNMETLPKLHDISLQLVVDAIRGDHEELVTRIQSRLDAIRKTPEQKEYFDVLSLIRKIPDEILAVFRGNIALVVQRIMADVQATIDAIFGKKLERQGIHAGKHGRALAPMGVEALQSAIGSRLGTCIGEARVAMYGYVDLIANGLLRTDVSQRDIADVAMEISNDAQQILSAKVAAVALACCDDAHRMVNDTLCVSAPQSLPRANMVQVDQRALVGTLAHGVGKQAVDLEGASTILQEPLADGVLRPKDLVNAQHDSEPCSAMLAVSPSELYAASPILFPGRSTPAHPADMSMDAADEGFLSGSVGHPEMCSRPCVRAAAGQCELGFSCAFCHMPHEKSAAHLDKKRRTALKNMTYEERVATVLPLIRLKLVELQLDQDLLQDVSDIIEMLQSYNYVSEVARTMRGIQRSQVTKFTLRSLFSMMKRDPSQVEPSELQAAMDLLFGKIRADIARRT